MKHLFAFTITFLLLTSLWAEARETYTFYYLQSYPETVGKGISAPLKWQGKDWLTAGSIVLSAGALYLADEEISDFFRRNQNGVADALTDWSIKYAEYGRIVPGLGISIVGGYLLKNEKLMNTGLLSLKSLVLASAATQSLKMVSGRARPNAELGNEFWQDDELYDELDSFPSGHTTVLWSIAPIIASQYRDRPWTPYSAYLIAIVGSLSRIYTNEHWASDVLAGAVIGYTSARLVQSSTPRVQVTPLPNIKGMGLAYQF